MKIYNIQQLSKELVLPVDWLKEQAKAGNIPCLRIKSKLRFNLEAVEAALAKMAAGGGNPDGK
jgi:hypothetical protein